MTPGSSVEKDPVHATVILEVSEADSIDTLIKMAS